VPSPAAGATAAKFYRPRNHGASHFYKAVTSHFDTFIQVYPARYQKDCGEEMFVPFSCKQRGVCPSCDQKRAVLLGLRLADEIIEPVPHRQWVFTIPKCLRIYFRFDRKLLGLLCRAAYETVKKSFTYSVGDDILVPGMVASIQTFGDSINTSNGTRYTGFFGLGGNNSSVSPSSW
jgi:hypothetical protein